MQDNTLKILDDYSIEDILPILEHKLDKEEYQKRVELLTDIAKTIKDSNIKSSFDEFWKNWDNNKKNFPFKYKGKELWFSRSTASVLFTFCYNSNGRPCLLANKRGSGTPDFQGFWNVCCGYIDYNETAQECAKRETKEETGIDVPLNKIKLFKVNSSPSENRQNISFTYFAMLDGTTDDYKFSTDNTEENEVSNIKWIPIDEIKNHKWAFDHDITAFLIISKIF